jgi:hypothetical protein
LLCVTFVIGVLVFFYPFSWSLLVMSFSNLRFLEV